MAVQGRYVYDWPRPMVTVDAVVFSRHNHQEEVLLIRRGKDPFAGQWAIPGGFLEIDEELDEAVARELKEETGLEGVHLAQFYTCGKIGKDPRGRMITVTYCGEAQSGQNSISGGDDAAEARWFDVQNLPSLAFNHEEIIDRAIAWRRGQGQLQTGG